MFAVLLLIFVFGNYSYELAISVFPLRKKTYAIDVITFCPFAVGCPYYNAPRSINLTTRSLMHNSSRREDMAQMLSLYAVCRPIVNLWCIKLCCLCLFVHLSCSVTTLSDVQTHKSQNHILGFPLRIFPVFLSTAVM